MSSCRVSGREFWSSMHVATLPLMLEFAIDIGMDDWLGCVAPLLRFEIRMYVLNSEQPIPLYEDWFSVLFENERCFASACFLDWLDSP